METDIHPVSADLYFLPVRTRVPLKFGPETLTEVLCARVCLTVADGRGRRAQGWGETPLSVQWTWPSRLGYQDRCDAMQDFCRRLAQAWAGFAGKGHPIEIGHDFNESALPRLLEEFNRRRGADREGNSVPRAKCAFVWMPCPHRAAEKQGVWVVGSTNSTDGLAAAGPRRAGCAILVAACPRCAVSQLAVPHRGTVVVN